MRPKAARGVLKVSRHRPHETLTEFVDYYWFVRWDPAESHRQQVVSQPRIQLAAEDSRLVVHEINRELFFRTLSGRGQVLGAAFLAGGFRPFLGSSVRAISGTVQPAGDLFGVDDRDTAARILTASEPREALSAMDHFLLFTDVRPDPTARQVTGLVSAAEHDATITRAEQLAGHAGVSLRTLQRLFTEHVGTGPKWVIRRFRLLDTAAVRRSRRVVHADVTSWRPGGHTGRLASRQPARG